MKRIFKITAMLVLLIVMLSSCVQVCVETKQRYAKALQNYPDLIPLKVDEIETKMQEGGNEYKLVYIYDGCENMFGKYISQTLVPYAQNNRAQKIGVYAIANDCGWLKDIEPVFKNYNIELPRYYIRDNSPEFINHGKSSINDLPDNRSTRIAKRLFVNAEQADMIKTSNTCYVVNAENKIKLARYTCNTRQGVKSVVIPCPIERIAEPLDQVDFDSIMEIEQIADDTDDIYIIYFWRYNN